MNFGLLRICDFPAQNDRQELAALASSEDCAAAHYYTPADNDESDRLGSLITTGVLAAEGDMSIADHVDTDASSWASENYSGGDVDPTLSSDDDRAYRFGPNMG